MTQEKMITFEELVFDTYVPTSSINSTVLYQVAKINLKNRYDFIRKIDDKYFFVNNTLGKVSYHEISDQNTNEQFVVFCLSNIPGSSNFVTINNTDKSSKNNFPNFEIIPVNTFKSRLHIYGHQSDAYMRFDKLTDDSKYRAIFYNELARVFASTGIEYSVFEKLISSLPKIEDQLLRRNKIDKAYTLVEEDVCVRYTHVNERTKQPVTEWKFLDRTVGKYTEFLELEYFDKNAGCFKPVKVQ